MRQEKPWIDIREAGKKNDVVHVLGGALGVLSQR
jgi:hypothetical protein